MSFTQYLIFFSLVSSAKMTMIEKKEDVCLLDSATTHSILKDKNYFSTMTLRKANVHTISGPVEMIDGFGNATIMLSNDTILHIEDALLNTIIEADIDCLCIISYKIGIKTIHEKIKTSISGLYCVPIRAIESYASMSWKLINPDEFEL